MKNIFLVSLLAFVAACAPKSKEDTILAAAEEYAKNSNFIVGGDLVEQDDLVAKSTVLIAFVPAAGSEVIASCSGILIATDKVLSAAHCAEWVSKDVVPVIVFATNGFEAGKNIRRASVQSIYPEYSENALFDLAIFKFSGEPVNGYQPVNIKKQNIADGKKVIVAGYGKYNIKEGVDYKLRKANKSIYRLPYNPELLYIRQSNGTGICFGDSGGPAYIQENEALSVVAVTRSFKTGEFKCNTDAYFVNLTYKPIYNWVKSQL